MKRLCTDQDLRNFFKDGNTHSIEEIQGHFNIKRIVAYNEMNRIKALRCINKTGHYVLSETAPSTRNGFLKIEEKVFFSGGNLSEALVHLIGKSQSGMSALDLEGTVCTNPRVQLLTLSQSGRIYREKFGGSYIYFLADDANRERQRKQRQAEEGKPENRPILDQLESLPLELVIKVLLTFIQHPDFSPKSIALSLVRRGERIGTRMVGAVFLRYNLSKKNF